MKPILLQDEDAADLVLRGMPGAAWLSDVDEQGRLTSRSARLFAKRAIDVAGALVLLILAAPACALIAVLIVIDSGSPVLFLQCRRGVRGHPFTILKFRTMGIGSDGRQAIQDDPRITRIGRFLRRSSLDELPQLLNVLKGDMSLVGPRPHPLWLDERYAYRVECYDARLAFRPGLTGLAQIRGLRGETASLTDMQRRVALDLEYIGDWSLLLDVKILLRTATLIWLDDHAR